MAGVPPPIPKPSIPGVSTPPSTTFEVNQSLYSRLPVELRKCAAQADTTLLRLNKLLTSTAGLDCFLATLNYSFYLLAYIQSRSPSPDRIVALVSRTSKPSPVSAATPSTLYTLANLISETRTTLRLTALLPLYSQLRSLVSFTPSPTSSPSYTQQRLLLLTTITYILYQLLENLAYLSDHRLFLHLITTLLPSYLLLTPESAPGTSPTWYASNRLWFLGVNFDFLRVLLTAYTELQGSKPNSVGKRKINRSREEQAEFNKQWRSDLLIAICWWPLTLHWSLRSGIRGINDGVIGVLGTMASWQMFKGQWAATALEPVERKAKTE